jgi:multiple sugar transport system substrate-binding protein
MSHKHLAGRGSSARGGLTRRGLLKGAGAGLAAATAAELGLFGGKPPAFAQGTEIHVMQQVSFVPDTDQVLDVIAAEFGKASGCTMKMEYVATNAPMPRTVAAVESGVGPDAVMLPWNQAHLFEDKFADVSDVVEAAFGNRVIPSNKSAVFSKGVYRGVPGYNIPSVMTYNKPICAEAGVTKYAATYDDLREIGKKLKKIGKPIGWCLGHTIGDGAFGNYMILWAFGGAEVDDRGRVIINSRQTIEACKWMRAFWEDACDETGMGWDDASNNQAYLAEAVGCVYNAASIYLKARRDARAATAKGNAEEAAKWNKLADNCHHTLQPAGPAGSYALLLPFNLHVPTYGKNQKLTKEWLKYMMAKPQYERWFTSAQGFHTGVTPEWNQHPMWKKDPQIEPFREVGKFARNMGFKGQNNRPSSEVQNKYIIADMLARSIKDDPESAVKWAEGELKLVYDRKA